MLNEDLLSNNKSIDKISDYLIWSSIPSRPTLRSYESKPETGKKNGG